MNFYFKGVEFEDTLLYLAIGGRGTGKKLQVIRFMCEYLFGGQAELDYNPREQCYYIMLRNDDIDEIIFSILEETLLREPLNVRLSRMCEEYEGFMRYKFRDSEE